MFLRTMKIVGYRGFQQEQKISFATPKQDGIEGSGLTIITGSNNSGKSSIIECLRAREGYNPPSFPNGVRNNLIDKVEIEYLFDERQEILMSVHKGSSETKFEGEKCEKKIFVVPSRRAFEPYFHKSEVNRETYILNTAFQAKRSSLLDQFSYRLFSIEKDDGTKKEFDDILEKVLGFRPEWAIDQNEMGQYFLKFTSGRNSYSSNGMGEGIVSIFVIVDALYDSQQGDIIVIDEPELSLHPSLQKRLSKLFVEYARDRQIVISTHSPYFVDINALSMGAALARVISSDEGTKIYQLSSTSTALIPKLAEGNLYNPHTWGLDAREFFFQEDGIILVEGQEDVILYPKIAEQLNKKLQGSFFGWGVGGAGNIQYLCKIAKDLGFDKVAAILDGDKRENFESLKEQFPKYGFEIIPADDIRTKPARDAVAEKQGLLNKDKVLQEHYRDDMSKIFDSLNEYFEK
ncbi:AAA family ATPase [Moraxella sp. FZFQ2102]|uniref:ATP-dependent nuclease n=1 Tax=Moraxella sp. FZFQ2102 TaxID=2953752 RepID=UPI00209BE241|nr:AAA family ATPase [Moraxella sp. FZFQ2102]USZ14962.1 AAA family ATPase [Moraxella sp. FZFQ2102]